MAYPLPNYIGKAHIPLPLSMILQKKTKKKQPFFKYEELAHKTDKKANKENMIPLLDVVQDLDAVQDKLPSLFMRNQNEA